VAIQLAKKYAQVIGVDASQAQLDHAYQARNVRYLCSAAEYLSEHLGPRSVDLIAMAETLHWVDHMPFYEQCRKILKPTGVVTIWCYDLNEFVSMGPQQDQAGVDKANALMRAFCYGVMGPFWDERRVHIDRHYVGLEPRPTQFRTCIREDDMNMEHILSMNHFMGYLASWSPYAAYRATYPDKEDPLIDLRAQFKKLLHVEDDDAPSLLISWPIFFLLIRDPVQDPEPEQQLLTGGRLVAREPSASQPLLPPPPGRLARARTAPAETHNTL
jgi:SAM-dependent methyltransferase